MAAVPLKANAAVRDDLMLAHADVDVPKLVPSRAGVIQAEIDAVLEHGGRAGSFPAEQTIEVKALGKRVLSQDADMEWAPPRKHASDLYASLSAVVKTLDTATRRQLAEIENLPIAARKGRKIELDAATFLELFNAHARRKPSAEARYEASDPICESAYLGAGINKNECMEFMIGPTTLSPSAVALMELRIASATKSDRIKRVRQAADERFSATFTELLPDYLARTLAVPLVVFLLGHTVAWVRRGFQNGK